MVLFAITVCTLALGLDAKQEAKETNTLAGHLPIDIVAEPHESTGSHIKAEDEAPVELSGMRDEDHHWEKQMLHVNTALTESAKDMVPLRDREAKLLQEFSPTETSPVRDREAKLLQEAGFKNAQEALKAGAEHKQKVRPKAAATDAKSAVDDREAKLLQDVGFKNAQEALKVGKQKLQVKKPNPATDSREVPYYFFNFPIAVKFIDENGKAKIAIMDRLVFPGELPIEFMYVYPLVFFLLYSFIWCLCCRRSNRTGLSFRLVIEAAACFMCLWADLATKHKVIGSGRAWSYVILMMILLSAWNIAELCVKDDDVMNNIVFWTFQSIVAIVWIAYSIERMYVRKFYRRSADPMAAAHPMTDCAAVACCGQFTALQEAQLMSNIQQDMQTSQKTHW